MNNETSKKSMTDVEIMNLAKERMALRNSFKMRCRAFFIVSALIAINSIFNNWGVGVAVFILGWGLLVAFHGVLVCFRFLDVSASVTGEYERIKRTVMNEGNFSNEGQKQNDVSKLPIIEGMAHESEAKQEYKQMSKTMTEERKIKLAFVGGKSNYQFTAVDECTRWTHRQMYDDKSSYSAKHFLNELLRLAPFPIRMVQTDNGTEFTNALLVITSKHKTLFEQALQDMDILYKRIRIATPRHNGKVERMHRTDQLRFYDNLKMFSLEDGRKQLASYNKSSNGYIMTCLDMNSPNEVPGRYLGIMF